MNLDTKEDIYDYFEHASRSAMFALEARIWISQLFNIPFVNLDLARMRGNLANTTYQCVKRKYRMLIKTKYNTIAYNYHPFSKRENKRNKFTKEEHEKEKKLLYNEILDFYNETIVPFLNEYKLNKELTPYTNFVFKKIEKK